MIQVYIPLTQTLTSPAKEVSENFGYALSFSGDILL